MESWMHPQAGNGEKTSQVTMISHWFPWSFGQLEPVWVSKSCGHRHPLRPRLLPALCRIPRSAPGLPTAGRATTVWLSTYKTWHSKMLKRYVYIACICSSSDYMQKWRNPERDSFKTYIRLHRCVSAERVRVLLLLLLLLLLYIYNFYIYNLYIYIIYIYNLYILLLYIYTIIIYICI